VTVKALSWASKGEQLGHIYTHIVKEIKDSSIGFEELGFVHENRRSNKEDHGLVRSCVLLEQGRQV
jgi:hypothetical protein